MATLTYNPEEPQDGELSAEEQESLQVGEQLEEQQNQLLAGKYKDAEELEKAYVELQSKLGKSEPETPKVEEQPQEEPQETSLGDELWEQWNSKDGVSQEAIDKLEGMSRRDITQMYLDYRNQAEENAAPVATEENVSQLKGMAGGEEGYAQMMQWASTNLSSQDIDLYDSVMERGDPAAMYFAVNSLMTRYQNSEGVEGQMITGKPARTVSPGFRSQAELVRAMQDPRYDNDPAYRQDVAQKLEVSNLDF